MGRALHVFNDLHIGVQRVAGTTKESALALRQDAINTFGDLLKDAVRDGDDICILGDLFDGFLVPLEDVAEVVEIFREVKVSRCPSPNVTLVLGNHDLSTDSTKMGAAQLVAAMVPGVELIAGVGNWVAEGVWAIPHLRNQEVFELALSEVPPCKVLMLHCNYNNGFAAQKDHSLNLSESAALDLLDSMGVGKILLAHEHQGRSELGGRVVVVGNQFPTSVSDCLPSHSGGTGGTKRAARIIDGVVSFVESWSAEGSFVDIPWDSDFTSDEVVKAEFIRVSGTTTKDRTVEAMRKVAKLRQTSSAFVVANAIRTPSDDGRGQEVASSVEDVRAVDAVDEFLKLLEQKGAWMRAAVETYIKENGK